MYSFLFDAHQRMQEIVRARIRRIGHVEILIAYNQIQLQESIVERQSTWTCKADRWTLTAFLDRLNRQSSVSIRSVLPRRCIIVRYRLCAERTVQPVCARRTSADDDAEPDRSLVSRRCSPSPSDHPCRTVRCDELQNIGRRLHRWHGRSHTPFS